MGRSRVVKVTLCDKCQCVFPDEDITVCYNFDESEILGFLCDACVRDWLDYEQSCREGDQ